MQKKRDGGLAVILLLMAAGVFVFRGHKGNERYYNGGALVEKELVLDERMSYRSDEEEAFYSLHAKGYACRFRVEHGAFELVQNSARNAWLRMDSLVAGDTLHVKFGINYEAKLQDLKARIPLAEVSFRGELLFGAEDLKKHDEKEQIFYLYISGALFLLALLLLALRYYGKNFQKDSDGDLSVKV